MQKCSTWSAERRSSDECDAEMQHMEREAAIERRIVMQKCSTWSAERRLSGECAAEVQHMECEVAIER